MEWYETPDWVEYIDTYSEHPEIRELIMEAVRKEKPKDLQGLDDIARAVLDECHRETNEALLRSYGRKPHGDGGCSHSVFPPKPVRSKWRALKLFFRLLWRKIRYSVRSQHVSG